MERIYTRWAQATRCCDRARSVEARGGRGRRGLFTKRLSVGLERVGQLRGAVERLRAVRVLRVELPVYLVQQRLPANNKAALNPSPNALPPVVERGEQLGTDLAASPPPGGRPGMFSCTSCFSTHEKWLPESSRSSSPALFSIRAGHTRQTLLDKRNRYFALQILAVGDRNQFQVQTIFGDSRRICRD